MSLRNIFTLLFFCTLPFSSYAQRGYYEGKGFKSVGVKIADKGDKLNSRICQAKKGKTELSLTPYDIDEYGFSDGRVYVSKDVRISDSVYRVFLLRLSTGKQTLYYQRENNIKTFYIAKDSTQWIELPENKDAPDSTYFRDRLAGITADCPGVADDIRVVSYNKSSMQKLFRIYNQCEHKPLPFLKLGVLAGFGWTTLDPSMLHNDQLDEFFFGYESRYVFGLFADMPLFMSDFSMHLELTYNKYALTYTEIIADRDYDFVANVSSVGMPLLLRYSYPSVKLRPYVNAGGYLGWNFKNENNLWEATVDHNLIEIADGSDNSLIAAFMGGPSIGCGLEYKLDFRRRIFIDCRFYRLYGLSDPKSMIFSEFLVTTGINF